MPEPSYHQPRQEHPRASAISLHDVCTGPPYEGELGEGVLLRTDRGDIQAILHQAPEAQHGVIWVGGARGGFGRPGQGAYARLADVLRRDWITSLRLCYRHPNVLPACALDILAGIASLEQDHVQRVVLVGHSFGGAVVITAGAVHEHVAGVVALAPQTYGASLAGHEVWEERVAIMRADGPLLPADAARLAWKGLPGARRHQRPPTPSRTTQTPDALDRPLAYHRAGYVL